MNYRPALQRTTYAIRELDSNLSLAKRLEEAVIQLSLLGRVDVVVPEEIRTEVEEMHSAVAAWVLPSQNDAIGTSVAWLSEAECREWEAKIRRWHEVVAAAVRDRDAMNDDG